MRFVGRSCSGYGFILVPVVFTLTLLAAIAFMLSQQGAINTGAVVRENQTDVVRYIAEAGLNHALWQANKSGACTGYTDLTDFPLGQHSYTTSIIPTNGSPVAIKVVGTHSLGASHTINRNSEKIYQPSVTVILQLGGDAGRDVPIDEFHKNNNYGDYGLMVSNSSSWMIHGLVYFDLSSLPADVAIKSAQLELYQLTNSGALSNASINVYRMTQDWAEGSKKGAAGSDGATWNTTDGSQNWNDGGGGSYHSVVIASTKIDTNVEVIRQWDITHLVQSWEKGYYLNQGLLLKGSGDMNKLSFASKEDAIVANRPKLTIIYACECGKTCEP